MTVFQHSAFRIPHSQNRRALTLVELLIVISVIAILLSAVLVGGSRLIQKSQENNTLAVLQLVGDAVEAFQREQTAKPTITSATQPGSGGSVKYANRYGKYPPDELEVFTADGLPGSTGAISRSLAPGGGRISAGSLTFGAMEYHSQSRAIEHRDQLAMIIAIETMSESASAILDRIPDKNRGTGQTDSSGQPAVFLDRPGPGCSDGRLDQCDLQTRVILDEWGNSISYMAQRDFVEDSTSAAVSSNHEGWNEASTEIIRMNGGAPVIFSYGADGKEQLSPTAMGNNAAASLVGDFEEEPPKPDHVVDNPLNDDNMYLNPQLRAKLAKGLQSP